MAKATYQLQIDWNNDGDYSDTGEDVTSRLLSLEWERGRDLVSQLTGRSRVGRLKAVLNNTSGDYSPFNTGSPLTGNLLPGRKVRLNGGSGSFPYTFPIVFNEKPHIVAFIESITPKPDQNGRDVVAIEAYGPLGFIEAKRASLAMATNLATGTAVGDILDAAAWPAADRTLDAGQTTMERFWLERMGALNALRVIEDTESGFIVEAKNGKIEFEDRHHRLKSPHTTSQATFSDALAAARSYSGISEQDPKPFIFNEFEVSIKTFTVGGLAVLWTMPESGADSPIIAIGETRTFWAGYPNPVSATNAVAVNAWTTPVATTDYLANSAADGSGTNLTANMTVVVTKFAQSMKIEITNDATVPAYMTLLQARGTPVTVNDPVKIVEENTASQTKYGERTFTNRSEFLPNSLEGRDWAQFNLSIYKDPIAFVTVTVKGGRDHNHLVEALTRDIGDRVTVVANRAAGANLGINEDFFIESERHTVDKDRYHTVMWELSPATAYAGFFVLDTSLLNTGRLAY